jgi:hypothetical protein
MIFLEHLQEEEVNENLNVYVFELQGRAAIIRTNRTKILCGACRVIRADCAARGRAHIGLRFVVELTSDLKELAPRKGLYLVIDWPFLLHGKVPLKRHIVASVLEKRGEMIYVQMKKQVLRTSG